MNNKVYLPTSASFLVTEDCNLACSYCFELDGRNKNKMTKETARKGLEFLCNNAIKNGEREFHVMLFGGEPLLNLEVVKEIFKYGLELAEKNNLNFTTSMVTNATILTTEVKRILNAYKNRANLNVQLSVDGIKKIHDRYRVTKNGNGSFDTIEKNIPEWKALFADNIDRLSVHGCSNRDTLPYLYENYIFFRENWGLERIWFMPIHSEIWVEKDLEIYEEQLNKIADYILGRCKKEDNYQEVINYAPIDRCLSLDVFPDAPCGAGKNFITVTATGEMFPCHQIYFNDPEETTKIGDLEFGIDEQKRSLFFHYDNQDLSCTKLESDCDSYHCYRCIAENWQQNRSILSTVGCGDVRCKMSKIERQVQLKVRKELKDMGLLNNSSNDAKGNKLNNPDSLCGNRGNSMCDVVVPCDGNMRELNQCNREENNDNETIAMALKLALDKLDTLEKGQNMILEKLLK